MIPALLSRALVRSQLGILGFQLITVHHKTPIILILLTLLTVIGGGCTSAPTTRPAPKPKPTLPPFELLQASHQAMDAVTSFRAQVKIDIRAQGELASVSMDVERANDGSLRARIDIDAPGSRQPLEIIIFEDDIYIYESGPGWIRKPADDLSGLDVHVAWAKEVASSADFFGNLIPQEGISWEIYQAKSLGRVDLAGSPAEHLEIGADLLEMWNRLDESQQEQFILARVLMKEPRELFARTEADNMELWLDDLGYVRKMHLSMGLSEGMSIDLEMIGSDFGEDIDIRIPNTLQVDIPGTPIVAPTPPGDSIPVTTPPSTTEASTKPPGTVAPPDEETPPPEESSTRTPPGNEKPLTRDEILLNLGLGIKLRGRNLSGVDLSYAHMAGADLQDSDLSDVNFYAADLSQSKLNGANFTGANLKRADLRFADLRQANLAGVSLNRLDMEGVLLNETQLIGVDLNLAWLENARLVKADLREANLSKAYLGGADLTKADLRGANLAGADLRMAILIGTDLSEADLSGAILTGTLLNGVNLLGANLTRTDLTDTTILFTNFLAADLSDAILELAFFGEGTAWRKAFCDEIHRCTRDILRERGAQIN